MRPIVVVADDHPLFRDAMRQAISAAMPDCEFPFAGNLEELRQLLREREAVDLTLLDLAMPGVSGFSGLISIRAEFPDTPVVVVSASEDPLTIRRCLDLGASGFIPKSSNTETMVSAVQAVLDGDLWIPSHIDLDAQGEDELSDVMSKLQSLTPQQSRVLSMLSEGLLNKQIAYELGVSEATVKAHVSAVLLKLGVDSRTQAVIILNRIGSGFVTAG